MRASLLSFVALLGAVAIAACSSSATTVAGSGQSSGGGGSGGGGGGGSSGGSGGSSSGASSGGLPADAGPVDGDVTANDAGGGVQTYTVQFGPIQVPPNTENTQCIVVNLHNPAPIHVGQIHDLLGNASHHMILYKVAQTNEQPTPFSCQPFKDTLNPTSGNPLVISQKKDDLIQLPPNVAFTLDANQMVRLEMHYINANPSQTVTLLTTSTLSTIPDSQYKWDASFLFIGDANIGIPAGTSCSTSSNPSCGCSGAGSSCPVGPLYFQMPSQYATSNFFAITGHEHHLGTQVQVWSATSASDPGTPVYTSTSWSDPPTTQFAPPLRIPAGGGFKYQCDWNNVTNNTVSFGESANDEMCFFWAYYWPSQGASVCFQDNGLTACCPGPNPLCSQI